MISKDDTFVPNGFIEWQKARNEVERRGFAGNVPVEPDLDCGSELFNEYLATWEQHQRSVDQLLCKALFAGSIRSSALLPSGRLIEIAPHVWGGQLSEELAWGVAPVIDGADITKGRILILVDDLDRAFPPPETRPKVEILKEEELPPYLRFMVQAAGRLGTTGNVRLPKQQIVSWLEEHWPKDLGSPSTGKLEFMATFLRHPEDEKGGHFRAARGS